MLEVTGVLISVSYSCTYHNFAKNTNLSIIDHYIVGAVSFFCAKFAVTNIVFTFCNSLQYKVYKAKKTKYLYFVLEVAGVLISVSYSCSYHIFDIFYFHKYIGFPYRYIYLVYETKYL